MFSLLLAAAAVTVPVQCEIISQTVDTDQLLVGQCGKSSVLIGQAAKFEAAADPATGTAIAVIYRENSRRVLLVRAEADGSAFLEDITSDLARLGGRAPRAGLGDLSIDITRFTSDATIAVTGKSEVGLQSPTQSGEFSAKTLIAGEQARKALPHVPPPPIAIVAEGKGPEAQSANIEGQE